MVGWQRHWRRAKRPRGKLSLAPKELTRLFPDLWEAKNAREALGGEEPREAYKDIIRVWGLLNAPPQPTMLGNWPMA
jgi:hypothetical protein